MESRRANITGSTKIFGVIGDPIDHTLSPAIQNAAFRHAHVNATYLAFPVNARELKSAVEGIRALGVSGLNVTTPHKTTILPYLDKIETKAAEVGSINTVKNENDALIGFNTDGTGALDAINSAGRSVEGQNILLLGAGGTARSIAYSLTQHNCSIRIANRTVSTARRLARELQRKFAAVVDATPLSKRILRQSVVEADTIVNASSMGLESKNPVPIEERWIRSDQLVFDIVYRPISTRLLRNAAAAGAKTINGLDMLVNQGARSFTLWTDKKAPIPEMRRAIRKELGVVNARHR